MDTQLPPEERQAAGRRRLRLPARSDGGAGGARHFFRAGLYLVTFLLLVALVVGGAGPDALKTSLSEQGLESAVRETVEAAPEGSRTDWYRHQTGEEGVVASASVAPRPVFSAPADTPADRNTGGYTYVATPTPVVEEPPVTGTVGTETSSTSVSPPELVTLEPQTSSTWIAPKTPVTLPPETSSTWIAPDPEEPVTLETETSSASLAPEGS